MFSKTVKDISRISISKYSLSWAFPFTQQKRAFSKGKGFLNTIDRSDTQKKMKIEAEKKTKSNLAMQEKTANPLPSPSTKDSLKATLKELSHQKKFSKTKKISPNNLKKVEIIGETLKNEILESKPENSTDLRQELFEKLEIYVFFITFLSANGGDRGKIKADLKEVVDYYVKNVVRKRFYLELLGMYKYLWRHKQQFDHLRYFYR